MSHTNLRARENVHDQQKHSGGLARSAPRLGDSNDASRLLGGTGSAMQRDDATGQVPPADVTPSCGH